MTTSQWSLIKTLSRRQSPTERAMNCHFLPRWASKSTVCISKFPLVYQPKGDPFVLALIKTHDRASRFQFSVVIVKMREATVNYFPIRNSNLTNQLIRSGDRKWSIRYDTVNYLEFRSPDLMAMNLLVLLWLSAHTISTYFRQLN